MHPDYYIIGAIININMVYRSILMYTKKGMHILLSEKDVAEEEKYSLNKNPRALMHRRHSWMQWLNM